MFGFKKLYTYTVVMN